MPQFETHPQGAPENREAHDVSLFSPELRSLRRIVGTPPPELPVNPSTKELTDIELKNVQDHKFNTFNEQYHNNMVLDVRGSLDRTRVFKEGTEMEKDALDIAEFIVVNQTAAYHEYFAGAVNHVTSLLQRYEELRAMTPNIPPELERREAVARLYVAALDYTLRERVAFANVMLCDGQAAQNFGDARERNAVRAAALELLSDESRLVLAQGMTERKIHGNTLNQRIIDVLAGHGRIEGVPDGFLPQKLYLDLLIHRYRKFLELQESLARDPVLAQSKERHRVLKERNDRAKRGQADPLNAEEGEEYEHLQRVLKNHEGELERMGGQRRATTEELLDFTDDLGHFQMDMAEIAHIQRQFGQSFNLDGANPCSRIKRPKTCAKR